MLTIGIGNDNAFKDNDNDAPNKEDTDAPEDDHKEIMASKGKPSAVPKAVAAKKPPAKVASSAARRPTIALYFLNMHDVAIVAYHNKEGINYAKAEVHANSMILPGTSRFSLAEDGMLVS